MLRRVLFILAVLNSASAMMAEPIELKISTTASPLQAWRALCADWQIMQWSGAESAYFDLRQGGPWRITHKDQTLEEGIIDVAVPGERLAYSYLYDEQETKVNIVFSKAESGCEINITHDEFGDMRYAVKTRAALLERWEARLPLLTAYLDQRPGSYLAKPYGEQTYPAVLLLHDRFGLDNDIREFADSLAANGYIALAVDMFKGDATSDMTQAAGYLELVNREESLKSARAGFDFLRSVAAVDSQKIAVWGFGFGGSLATAFAAQVPELKLCINWYGADLPADDQIPRIACPVLGVFAGAQPENATAVAESFNQRLTQAGIGVETIIVLGSDGFADRAYGVTYSTTATAEAWQRTLTKLDRELRM